MKILKGLLMIITAPIILLLTLLSGSARADLHIWSGAWPVQHGDCSAWRGCAYYLFPRRMV